MSKNSSLAPSTVSLSNSSSLSSSSSSSSFSTVSLPKVIDPAIQKIIKENIATMSQGLQQCVDLLNQKGVFC